ncbi:MAG: hypothetical protein M0T74_09645 [Desulfitobacterium hafniense]|nr:hypothetical protein [Desulfitobacterium hafniense]
MNSFERRMKTRLCLHPNILRSILSRPNEDGLTTLIQCKIFDSPNIYLAQWISTFLPKWEIEACQGSEVLAKLINHLEKSNITPIKKEKEILLSNLQRIRILAQTPGKFLVSPFIIQENLIKYLASSDIIADLPELEVISFSKQEIEPLNIDLSNYKIAPHSRRYIQNLFHPERQEAILSVLAYIAKNHSIFSICRQAYAIMLSLDDKSLWANNPFCLRLIANRFWEYQVNAEK